MPFFTFHSRSDTLRKMTCFKALNLYKAHTQYVRRLYICTSCREYVLTPDEFGIYTKCFLGYRLSAVKRELMGEGKWARPHFCSAEETFRIRNLLMFLHPLVTNHACLSSACMEFDPLSDFQEKTGPKVFCSRTCNKDRHFFGVALYTISV